MLATVSNSDNSFECHIKLNEVKRAVFAMKENAKGKKLYIIRLLGDSDATLLSAILHGEDGGEVDEGAIQFWGSLQDRFGERVDFQAAN